MKEKKKVYYDLLHFTNIFFSFEIGNLKFLHQRLYYKEKQKYRISF